MGFFFFSPGTGYKAVHSSLMQILNFQPCPQVFLILDTNGIIETHAVQRT